MAYQFNAEQQRTWNQGYRALLEAEELCSKVAACGLDATDRQTICAALREKFEKLREQFMPKGVRE